MQTQKNKSKTISTQQETSQYWCIAIKSDASLWHPPPGQEKKRVFFREQ